MKDGLGQRTYTNPPMLDEPGLIAYLETQQDVVAAYLCGSLAQHRATPRSDVDIAILLSRTPDVLAGEPDRQLQLMAEIERFADRDVDVIILNTATPTLQYQLLRTGRRLYEGDRQARIDFEVRVGQIYEDLRPMHEFFEHALLREIRETGMGGYG